MAGIDYTIPGQFKGIQIESPMNAMAQAMQLRNLQESSEMNALKRQEYQQLQQEQNALANLYGDRSLDFGSDEFLRRAAVAAPRSFEGVATRAAQRENLLAQRESRQAETQKRQFEAKKLEGQLSKENYQTAVGEILSYNSLADVVNDINQKEAAGEITPQQAAALKSRLPKDDAGLDSWRIATMRGLLPPKEQYAEIKAERAAAYEDYSLAETFAGRVPVSQEEFFSRQRGGQTAPVAEPTAAPTVAPTAVQDGGELSQADLETEFLSRPRDDQAAPAPAPVPAPGEDRMLPGDTTTVKKTGVDYLDPTAQQLYQLAAKTKDKDRRLALTAMAKEIQDAFVAELKSQKPTYSEINLGDKVAVAKRDPATGKTTIVDSFPINISPTDKQRLINESTRIKQENKRIQLDAQRVDLETKRVAITEQNATRDADPAFQERMAAARAKGTETTKNQIKAQQILPSVISRGEEGIRLIDELIGKAPVKDKDGRIIEKGTKPHPGFETAVGATWSPGLRFVPGTSTADFQARLDQLQGASFLEAFETLKGGGQITVVEGEKATAAINRMRLAQSEKEFIAAGREVQKLLDKGIENAKTRVGVAPAEQSSVRSEANAILGIP